MKAMYQRRAAALLEVLGVFLAGQLLRDRIDDWVIDHKILPPVSPFDLLTPHASNADLLLASQQMLAFPLIQYFAYFLIVIPINWWYRPIHRWGSGPASYGLTRAGLSWKTLLLAGLATACLCEWPLAVHSLINAIHPLGATAPWRQAFFDMSWRGWQFWLFAGIFSYALVPLVEELLHRGYYQRRLAEDWGDGAAIAGATCLFTFARANT
jgi:membrane protease YdiL (CAAX protease family)